MKPHMERRPKKYVNVGRSVEEVILRRKFDSTNPTTWPDPLKTSVKSQALPNIPDVAVAKPSSYLSDYPEDDKQKMMDTLMSYCRALQNKVEDLESQLLSSNNRVAGLMSRSYDFGAAPPRSAEYFNQRQVYTGSAPSGDDRVFKIRIQSPRESTPGSASNSRRNTSAFGEKPSSAAANKDRDSSSQQPMGKIMSAIDVQVLNLKELFRRGDPMDERKACATKIAALIRGFLARQWVRQYRRSLREFTLTRCRMVIFLVDILLSNQSKLDAGFHLLKMNRNMKKLHVVFLKWATVCHQNAPVRRAVKVAAAEKIESKRLELMRAVFKGLHAVSIGDKSTKHANAVRRKLIEGIRAELSFKMRTEGQYGVVPEAEVVKVLHRRVVQNFWERKNQILTRFVWKTFVGILSRSRQHQKAAVYHRFKQLVGRCFLAWSNYIFLVGMGLDRKRWPGPRKYEVKYNQKRVNNFSRVRMLKTIFKAWKGYFSIQYKVKLRFRGKVAQLVASAFRGWKEAAASQHRMRLTVYDNWKGYARLMVYGPFHAWAGHVKAVKNHHNEQIRICNSYVRWKWRQRIIHIVKVWRHQALYGRLDGLYSRQMLLKTLGEQKIMVNSVEKLMAAQTMELEDCRNIVNAEIVKRKELEKVQAVHIGEISKLKMTNHNYEQELRKLESVVESMFKINPKQISYIKEMHPHFKFKERHILLPTRGENDSSVAGSAASVASETPSMLPPLPGETPATTAGGVGAGVSESVVGSSMVVSSEQPVSASFAVDDSVDASPHSPHHNDEDDQASVVSALSVGTAGGTKPGPAAASTAAAAPLQLQQPSNEADDLLPAEPSVALTAEASKTGTATTGSYHTPTSTGGHAASAESPTPGTAAAAAVSEPAAVTSTSAAATTTGAAAAAAAALPGSPLPFNAAIPGVTRSGQTVSDEDMLLLARVKWILKRYGDELKHHETHLHTAAPLDLLLPREQQEEEDRFREEGEKAAAGGMPESEEFDVDSLVLRDRPSLLLQQPANKTAAASARGGTPATPDVTNSNTQANAAGTAAAPVPILRQSGAAPFLNRLISSSNIASNSRISFSERGYSERGFTVGQLTTQTSSASLFDGAAGVGGSSVSVRILLAFMDFLDYGDVSLFSETDRRDWIRTLLKKTSESVLMNNEFAGLTGDFPEEVNDVLENRSETPVTPFTREAFDGVGSTSLVTLDNNMNGAKSWRDALMQFRCFTNSDPSIIANLRDENVSDADVAMFGRILAMRDNSEVIMKRQTAKFRAKLKEKITYQFGANASGGMLDPAPTDPVVSEEDALFPRPVSDPPLLGSNIYASNLKLMRNHDEATAGSREGGFVSDMQKNIAASRQQNNNKMTDEDDEMGGSPAKR